MLKQFTVKADWRVSKVIQVANAVKSAIHQGQLGKNEQLPSINNFSRQYQVSRDTVEKAYKMLKDEGYLAAVKGRGFFVSRPGRADVRILLILNDPGFYQSSRHHDLFFEPVNSVNMDLRWYRNDLKVFRKIIKENLALYHYYYVVLPRSRSAVKERQIQRIVDLIPQAKRLVLQEKE